MSRLMRCCGLLTLVAGLLTAVSAPPTVAVGGSTYSAPQYRWASVDGFDPDRPGQNTDAKVGYFDNPLWRYRSFFQVNTAPIAGAVVTRTWFAITLDHSWSCDPTAVDLWHTANIPASGVTWNNSAGYWKAKVDTRPGRANEATGCGTGQPDMPMEFSSADLTRVVQQAADTGTEALTFGLRAPDEGKLSLWKRFNPATARLVVEYNTRPRTPASLGTVPPTPCGTATAPTALNTTTPSFSAVASDPDNDTVQGRLEILRDDTVLTTLDSAPIRSGTAFGWPALSPLPEATVLSYRARIVDSALASPDTPRCYFVVDKTRPGPPEISSADFPDGVAVRSVGEAGSVTFTRADPDVIGFRYGFQQDTTTGWVPAAADGTAKVPITLWPGDFGIDRPLYVRAVDRAGNLSASSPDWYLTANPAEVTAPPVRSDVNGDRHADVTAVLDQGDGRTAVWNIVSNGTAPHIGWDSGTGGGFPAYRTKSATGDFDGDGRTDVALLREDPDRLVRLYILRSDGNRFVATGDPAWTGSSYRLSHLRMVAGDFDGDHDDDLAVYHGTRLWVHYAAGGGFAEPVLAWEGPVEIGRLEVVAGDFDGDGDDDLAEFRGDPASGTRVEMWQRLSVGTVEHIGPVLGLPWAGARHLAANVTGDPRGQDEIVSAFTRPDGSTALVVSTRSDGVWASYIRWEGTLSRPVFATGDFTSDGRGDVAVLSDSTGGNRQLGLLRSNGTGFGALEPRWTGPIGDRSTPLYIEPGRSYRLQPQHSEKCAEMATSLRQADCVTGAANQQFLVERIGSTPYFRLKVSGKCLDVADWSRADNATVRPWTCDGGGNQQFRIDYVSGTGLDTVVRPRILHSDKCLDASGIAIVQFGCAEPQQANQQFYLRPVP